VEHLVCVQPCTVCASNTNKVINVIKCSFLDFFVDILFLTVKIHLLFQLQITHFFASGQTCEIGGGSNTYFPHCTYSLIHFTHLCFKTFLDRKSTRLNSS